MSLSDSQSFGSELGPTRSLTVSASKDPGRVIRVENKKGNRFMVEVDGLFYYRNRLRNGEWIEAEAFFPEDPEKAGMAVTIIAPLLREEGRSPGRMGAPLHL
jgi:hypothetical protein